MSTASTKTKSRSTSLPDLDRQVAHTKAVLRQLRDTLEDLDDRPFSPTRSSAPGTHQKHPLLT